MSSLSLGRVEEEKVEGEGEKEENMEALQSL
jgi:hypothetical protein